MDKDDFGTEYLNSQDGGFKKAIWGVVCTHCIRGDHSYVKETVHTIDASWKHYNTAHFDVHIHL